MSENLENILWCPQFFHKTNEKMKKNVLRLTTFCLFFGRIKDTIIYFQNRLTFINKFDKGLCLIKVNMSNPSPS